jgi:tetratricopeptide (TPR) repeat protein
MGQFVFLIALSAAAIFLGRAIYKQMRPVERVLRKARSGRVSDALADLEGVLQKKGKSPALLGALGQIYLIDRRPLEAEIELRKALELGSRERAHLSALGWALVQLARLDEALPIAEEANAVAHEDLDVYCLYCGLMAHHGRGAEVSQLFDFLKRSSAQVEKIDPKAYRNCLSQKFDFARTNMNAAGFA